MGRLKRAVHLERLQGASGKTVSAFDTLKAFLATYGTPIIFAPYYDPARTADKTYDLGPTGTDYLTLTGAVFDATTKAMVFDGVDDYADGHDTPASSEAIFLAGVVVHNTSTDAYPRVITYGSAWATGAYTLSLKDSVSTMSTINDAGVLKLSSTSYVGDTAKYLHSLLISDSYLYGYTNATAMTITHVACTKRDPSTSMRVGGSRWTGISDLKGSVHLALCLTGTNVNLELLRAKIEDGTFYTLVKAAFPWVALP